MCNHIRTFNCFPYNVSVAVLPPHYHRFNHSAYPCHLRTVKVNVVDIAAETGGVSRCHDNNNDDKSKFEIVTFFIMQFVLLFNGAKIILLFETAK